MLKIFSTQLQGLFKKIEEHEEMNFEEGARLLSQALIGDGTLFIHGLHELKAVELTATAGPEKLNQTKAFFNNGVEESITSLDRFLLIARTSTDPDAIEIAKSLANKGIPIVAISSIVNKEEEGLQHIADVHINSYLTKGLIPDELGNRFGIPTALIALYTYYGLYFTITEILEEY